MSELDLSELPDEVTDYAFDQYDDRLGGHEMAEAIGTLQAQDLLSLDYGEQTVSAEISISQQLVLDACREKIRDIEYEVEHGERDDFSLLDVQEMRDTLQLIRRDHYRQPNSSDE